MQARIEQLKKLRSMSAVELRVRGRQQLTQLYERVFAGSEMSDAALLEEIYPWSRNCSAEGTAGLIAGRFSEAAASGLYAPSLRRFIPALAHRERVVALMKSRYPAESLALIGRADQAAAGRFDLLGFKGLGFGDPIDWLLEPTTGKRTSLAHWGSRRQEGHLGVEPPRPLRHAGTGLLVDGR
jgi:hypothetical protein